MTNWLHCVRARRNIEIGDSEKQTETSRYTDDKPGFASAKHDWVNGQNYAEYTKSPDESLWSIDRLDIAPIRPVIPSHTFVFFAFSTDNFHGLEDARIEVVLENSDTGKRTAGYHEKIADWKGLCLKKDGDVVRNFSGAGKYSLSYDMLYPMILDKEVRWRLLVRAYLPDGRTLAAIQHDLVLKPHQEYLYPERPGE